MRKPTTCGGWFLFSTIQPLPHNALLGGMMHMACPLSHQPIVSLLIKVVLIQSDLTVCLIQLPQPTSNQR